MKPNVFITGRERGKLKYRWEGHNVWTDPGRAYLAQMIAYSSVGPDTPFISDRLYHMQFGIGSGLQSQAVEAAVDAAYPAGYDPHATDGYQYNHLYPVEPSISTLERPVRITGGSNPYPSADPGDEWMTNPTSSKFFVTQPVSTSVTLRYFIDAGSGDIAYAPFTAVPVTEAGLVVDYSGSDINSPYNTVVAYVNFDIVAIDSALDLEVVWNVNF